MSASSRRPSRFLSSLLRLDTGLDSILYNGLMQDLKYPAGFVRAVMSTVGVSRGRVYQVLDRAPASMRALSLALGAVESLKSEGLTTLKVVERLLEKGEPGRQAWFTYSLAGRKRSVYKESVSWLGVLVLLGIYYDSLVLDDLSRGGGDGSALHSERPAGDS